MNDLSSVPLEDLYAMLIAADAADDIRGCLEINAQIEDRLEDDGAR